MQKRQEQHRIENKIMNEREFEREKLNVKLMTHIYVDDLWHFDNF